MYVLLLCLGYFISYTLYGIVVRYYVQVVKMPGMEFLFHSTLGSVILALGIVLVSGWYRRLKSTSPRIFGGLFPGEYAWLIPSGICTAFVIPTTSLMYTFGFNIMVAMIIMRSSLIVISRVVDEILIRQGHSDKKVYWQENMAALVAIVALSSILLEGGKGDTFDFFHSPVFLINLACYIIPYGLRLYILSRFKTKIDSRALFGIEQLWAAAGVALGVFAAIFAYTRLGWAPQQLQDFSFGFFHPNARAALLSTPYGLVAVFSVFLFIYKFGSATFNTIVNRVTSLVAGTAATVIAYQLFGGKPVASHEWTALGIVLIAIAFLTWAGRRREAERVGAGGCCSVAQPVAGGIPVTAQAR